MRRASVYERYVEQAEVVGAVILPAISGRPCKAEGIVGLMTPPGL